MVQKPRLTHPTPLHLRVGTLSKGGLLANNDLTKITDCCGKTWVAGKAEPIPLSSGVSWGAYVRV